MTASKKLLEEKGRELASALRGALPDTFSFVVVLSDGRTTSFFSDSSRTATIATLRTVLAQLEEP